MTSDVFTVLLTHAIPTEVAILIKPYNSIERDECVFGMGRRRRPSIPQGIKTKVLQRSRGRCERCHKDVIGRGLKPKYHHKDGNPSHNTASNVVLLCNDCHDKVHEYRTVTERDMFGFPRKRRVLVAKRIRKPGRKKKKRKTRKKRKKYYIDLITGKRIPIRKKKKSLFGLF